MLSPLLFTLPVSCLTGRETGEVHGAAVGITRDANQDNPYHSVY